MVRTMRMTTAILIILVTVVVIMVVVMAAVVMNYHHLLQQKKQQHVCSFHDWILAAIHIMPPWAFHERFPLLPPHCFIAVACRKAWCPRGTASTSWTRT